MPYGSFSVEREYEVPTDSVVNFFCPIVMQSYGVPPFVWIVGPRWYPCLCVEEDRANLFASGMQGHMLDLTESIYEDLRFSRNLYERVRDKKGYSWKDLNHRRVSIPSRPFDCGEGARFSTSLSRPEPAAASGANDLIRITKRELLNKKYTDKIKIRITGCHGFCEMEPSILIEPSGIFYPKVDAKKMSALWRQWRRGRSQRPAFHRPRTGNPIERQADIRFSKNKSEPYSAVMRKSIPFAF